MTTQDEIRQLVDASAAAVRTKEVDTLMSHFAPDVLSFDVVGPLQHIGTDAARKRSEEWFASFEGPIGYQVRDLTITAGDDIAFCHSLNQVSAMRTEPNSKCGGAPRSAFAGSTASGWSLINTTRCRFDAENGRAAVDLEPQVSLRAITFRQVK